MRTLQPVCKRCGQALSGTYITALGATWHPEHFLCAGCKKPINTGGFVQHQGSPYHKECFGRGVAPHCAYCNKPLVGQYIVDHWGTQFCPEHQDQYPECRFCGRLVPPQQQVISERNGNSISIRCAACRANAVESMNQAQPLFMRLVQWVNGQGLLYNNLKLRIELCSAEKLGQNTRGGGGDTLGTTLFQSYSLLGIMNLRTEVKAVGVLRGLPSALFQAVAVHELGHVWLGVHGVISLPDWGTEGFCELLAYHLLTQKIGTAESHYYAATIEQSTDIIYGDGFRRVRGLAKTIGFRRLLEGLLTSKQLPIE